MSRERQLLSDRLWAKVNKSSNENDCWLFTGAINSSKYGVISRPGGSTLGTNYYAHVVVYALEHNLDPEIFHDRGEVIQTCQVRNCCNPKHLVKATVVFLRPGTRVEVRRNTKEVLILSKELLIEFKKVVIGGRLEGHYSSLIQECDDLFNRQNGRYSHKTVLKQEVHK
jgi:hypothetical protein